MATNFDYELTMDLLIGPVINRALATRGRLEPTLAERIVSTAWSRSESRPGSQPVARPRSLSSLVE